MFARNNIAKEQSIFNSRTLTAHEIEMVGGGLEEWSWAGDNGGGGGGGGDGGGGGGGGTIANPPTEGNSNQNESVDNTDRSEKTHNDDTPESAAARAQYKEACDALSTGVKATAELFGIDAFKKLANEVGPFCNNAVDNTVDAAYRTQIYEQKHSRDN